MHQIESKIKPQKFKPKNQIDNKYDKIKTEV